MLAFVLSLLLIGASPQAGEVEVVTAEVPFPRGLVVVDGALHVLSRGKVRGQGGADATLDDSAGTIWRVGEGGAVTAVARPTEPPFKLLRPDAVPATLDHQTDRPYCVLRFDEATQNFFICAFSGIDKVYDTVDGDFRKNNTDALLRFDLRTRTWHEIDRHRGGWNYPHHDPAANDPPHGLLKGPNNCLVVDADLWAVGKDNNAVARYDLTPIVGNPAAGPLPGEIVWQTDADGLLGPSALAARDGFLYVGFRTSGEIVRTPLNRVGEAVEIVARFPPWDEAAGTSADITDIDFDAGGLLYVVNAQPAVVHRFRPDPASVYDGRGKPWRDVAAMLDQPRLKAENLLVTEDGIYLTTGDAYGRTDGLAGVVYRLPVDGS
jgi:hypothetical protein